MPPRRGASRHGGAPEHSPTGANASTSERECRGRGSNPHVLSDPGFSYRHGFRRPCCITVRGLDCPFTVPRLTRIRCCPSSLYTFVNTIRYSRLARDHHAKGFPDFEQFCTAGFHSGHSITKSCASACSATPAGPLIVTLGSGSVLKGWVPRPIRAVASCSSDPIAPSVRQPSRQQRGPESAR